MQHPEEHRAKANQIVDEVLMELPSPDLLDRFRKRHKGFIYGYVLTDNPYLALLYGQRMVKEEVKHSLSHQDAAIGRAIVQVIEREFPMP